MEIVSKTFQVHPSSIIELGVEIGDRTKIWHWVHICKNVKIGDRCSIGQNCYIDEGVEIGDNVKIGNGVSIYKGVVIEDDVFIGTNATFINVRKPRSYRVTPVSAYQKTIVRKGATIGANATVLCGIEVGYNSTVGAGAVINKDVDRADTVIGNPAHSMRDYNNKLKEKNYGKTKD